MKCSIIQKRLSAYLDGEVTAEERQSISKHIKTCSICKKEYQALSNVKGSLKLLQGMNVPSYFTTRLKQSIRDAESPMSRVEKIRRIAVPVFATALAIVSLVIGNYIGRVVYQGIAETEEITETANLFGMDSFNEFPEGSISDMYDNLVTGGKQ